MSAARLQTNPSIVALRRIASNYAWTWDERFRSVLDSALRERWTQGTHPLPHLAALSQDEVLALTTNEALTAQTDLALAALTALEGSSRPTDIAFFSPEFGVSETLPQYSGGLGILA